MSSCNSLTRTRHGNGGVNVNLHFGIYTGIHQELVVCLYFAIACAWLSSLFLGHWSRLLTLRIHSWSASKGIARPAQSKDHPSRCVVGCHPLPWEKRQWPLPFPLIYEMTCLFFFFWMGKKNSNLCIETNSPHVSCNKVQEDIRAEVHGHWALCNQSRHVRITAVGLLESTLSVTWGR